MRLLGGIGGEGIQLQQAPADRQGVSKQDGGPDQANLFVAIQLRQALTRVVNCSTAWLTAADLMDSNMSKSWWAPGSSA